MARMAKRPSVLAAVSIALGANIDPGGFDCARVPSLCERQFLMSTPDVDVVVPGVGVRTARAYRRLGFL
jgi:hypothetical protein